MPARPLKADELFAAWSRQLFKPIYLFTGPEDLLIEEAILKLIAQRQIDENGGINRDRLDADKVTSAEILQACQTMPFGGPCRFVEVRNTHRLSAEHQKRLAEGLSDLPTSTQLVMIWGKEWRREDAQRPLIDTVQRTGEVVIFWPLFPEQAQRWLLQRAKHYQKTLAPEAAAWLIQEMGEGLRGLDQELAKTCAFVGERRAMTLEDVQACFGYQKGSSPYTWVAALRQKSYTDSMQTLRRLLEEGEEPLRLLAMASGSLRDWLAAKEGPGDAVTPARRFNVRRGDETQLNQDLEKLSAEHLMAGLSSCVEAHQSIKTGKESPTMALTLLTLRLCGLERMDAGRQA